MGDKVHFREKEFPIVTFWKHIKGIINPGRQFRKIKFGPALCKKSSYGGRKVGTIFFLIQKNLVNFVLFFVSFLFFVFVFNTTFCLHFLRTPKNYYKVLDMLTTTMWYIHCRQNISTLCVI